MGDESLGIACALGGAPVAAAAAAAANCLTSVVLASPKHVASVFAMASSAAAAHIARASARARPSSMLAWQASLQLDSVPWK